jgi:3-oxoadipate CoA-transferase alpha subunit
MIDKRYANIADAVAGIPDGATILVGGFAHAGVPNELIDAVAKLGSKRLVMVGNGATDTEYGHGQLMTAGMVDKFVCSFPKMPTAPLYEAGHPSANVEIEIVPQGTLAERIRAGGVGVPGFYTATSFGTPLGEGKEIREFDGRSYVFERAIKGDVALIMAQKGDRLGNLVYRGTARNFNPIMAMAAELTIAQVFEIVEPGDIDPEHVITPGIFVDRVIQVPPRS